MSGVHQNFRNGNMYSTTDIDPYRNSLYEEIPQTLGL